MNVREVNESEEGGKPEKTDERKRVRQRWKEASGESCNTKGDYRRQEERQKRRENI